MSGKSDGLFVIPFEYEGHQNLFMIFPCVEMKKLSIREILNLYYNSVDPCVRTKFAPVIRGNKFRFL